MANAERRLGKTGAGPGRRPRSDRGASRLSPEVIHCLVEVASGTERPKMTEMLRELESLCAKKGLRAPSRAGVYKILDKLPVPTYRVRDLPKAVREALYNLNAGSEVPAHQLAFYCFNYGDLKAVSFAAALPWLALYQAVRMPGYRKKSRGLALAVTRARNI